MRVGARRACCPAVGAGSHGPNCRVALALVLGAWQVSGQHATFLSPDAPRCLIGQRSRAPPRTRRGGGGSPWASGFWAAPCPSSFGTPPPLHQVSTREEPVCGCVCINCAWGGQ